MLMKDICNLTASVKSAVIILNLSAETNINSGYLPIMLTLYHIAWTKSTMKSTTIFVSKYGID